jgi:predicted HNH restriction endonuclease
MSREIGFKHTEETKNKIRESLKGRTHVYRGGHVFTEEDRKKSTEKTVERHRVNNESYLELGLYEKLSPKFRRKVLLEEAKNSCEVCKNNEWLGKQIWLEIHHIDDDNKNNKRENLLIVCPNCHSAIDKNYRFRGRTNKGVG